MQSNLSSKLVLTSDENEYCSDKTDEDFNEIGKCLQQARSNTHNIANVDDFNKYEIIRTKHGKLFPTYEDPIVDIPLRVGCRGLAEIISRYVTDENARLIDIGAGTGYLGIEAKKLGFTNIDCMEPCQTFVTRQPTGLYNKLYDDVISLAKPCQIETGFYDCAMMNGVVLSNHIEVEDVPELIRIVKPGGHVIFSIPDYWWKYKDFGTHLDDMLQKELENGTLGSIAKERLVYVYRVEDATCYILKKAL